MALIPGKPGNKSDAVAMRGVSAAWDMARSEELGGAHKIAARAESHDLAAPHEIFTLGLDKFTKGLKGAVATGWRYLVMEGDNAIAAAEVDNPHGPGAGGPKFSNLNTGRFVTGSLLALTSAENLPEVQKHDFELRLLQIPALHQMALWLHGPQDLLFPVDVVEVGAAGGAGNKAATPVSPHDYFDRLMPQYRQMVDFDDTPEASEELADRKIRANLRPLRRVAAHSAKKAAKKKSRS